jgi:hypothetical protein
MRIGEDNSTDSFKIICIVCGHDDCYITSISKKYWDDGYVIVCNYCPDYEDDDK